MRRRRRLDPLCDTREIVIANGKVYTCEQFKVPTEILWDASMRCRRLIAGVR
jgi:hypothetical protein